MRVPEVEHWNITWSEGKTSDAISLCYIIEKERFLALAPAPIIAKLMQLWFISQIESFPVQYSALRALEPFFKKQIFYIQQKYSEDSSITLSPFCRQQKSTPT